MMNYEARAGVGENDLFVKLKKKGQKEKFSFKCSIFNLKVMVK